jgi:hypothetical protein
MRSDNDKNETMDPGVERELEALDKALAGLPVEKEFEGLAELVSDLRADRPEPDPDWAAELDKHAAARFKGRRRSSSTKAGSRFGTWLGSLSLGQVLAPAAAMVTLVMVVAVGVSVTADDRGDSSDGGAAPMTLDAEAPNGESAVPVPEAASSMDAGADGAVESFESESGYLLEDSDGAFRALREKTAPGREKRMQDRSAILALKTDTEKVREVNDEAIQITESVGGVVLTSSLDETDQRATATLELSIPTRELDATLDRLTDLATVASLNEASEDITKPFVSAQDNLEDAEAERDQLLDALAEAEDGPEADSIRAQLDIVREEISRAEAQFENIARQARISNVSLTIEGTPGGDDDGSWSLGDAADDALEALKTVAGVMLVGAAIVLPIVALIALLVWLGMAARKRSRESALDD